MSGTTRRRARRTRNRLPAFTHLGCMVQAARLHGRCPNCRAAPRAEHCRPLPRPRNRCERRGAGSAAQHRSCRNTRLHDTHVLPRGCTPSPWSPPTSAPFAAAAWPGLRWDLSRCLTTACTGRRCPAVDKPASPAGMRCGSACVARASWSGSECKSPAHAVGGGHESTHGALGV